MAVKLSPDGVRVTVVKAVTINWPWWSVHVIAVPVYVPL